MDRKEFLEEIKSNINRYGHHISIVSSRPNPRYAYTIGLTKTHGLELILSGGIYFDKNSLCQIINTISDKLKTTESNRLEKTKFNLDSLGIFKLQKVDYSWSGLTMLGVLDFYNLDKVEAYQILPDELHYTLDIPDMSKKWSAQVEPIWKWLNNEWDYGVSEKTAVVTNLDALKGRPITEIMRWELEEWEMFAGSGPDVDKKDIRIVPIGVLLGIDNSLITALDLEIGKGLWRENSGNKWNSWESD